jgi:head-tail adaptor
MYGRAIDSDALDPGLLRHQITWQKKVVSGQNSYGEDNFSWVNFLTCRACVEGAPRRGETQQAMQRWAEAEYQITQHFSPGLEAKMRIAWWIDGAMAYLDVLNIDDPPGTGRYQKILARTFEGTFTA